MDGKPQRGRRVKVREIKKIKAREKMRIRSMVVLARIKYK
jgi:hypothetical protein